MGPPVRAAHALDEVLGAPGFGIYVMARHAHGPLDLTTRRESCLSLAECRDLLGEEGMALSDEEADAVRQHAETMAHVLIEIFLESRPPRK